MRIFPGNSWRMIGNKVGRDQEKTRCDQPRTQALILKNRAKHFSLKTSTFYFIDNTQVTFYTQGNSKKLMILY